LFEIARKTYLNDLTLELEKKEACIRMACGNCVMASSALLGEAVDFCIEVRCFLYSVDIYETFVWTCSAFSTNNSTWHISAL